MPDNLYGTAAGLLEGAGHQATENARVDQEKTGASMQAGTAASAQVGEDRRQASAQDAQKKIAQMEMESKLKGEMITITPQLAMGLVKNTGDKEWMKSVGQSLRADVYTGLYTHGMAMAQAKKAPKITQIYDDNGKVRHSVVYTDEDGNQQQLLLDQGMTPEQLNKGKGGKKGGAGSDLDFKKMKEFNRTFEKARSELSDPIKSKEMKALDPDTFREKSQFVRDNQDQYDANVKSLGKGGGAPVGGSDAPAAGGGQADSAPFDADAFIKDALGNQ